VERRFLDSKLGGGWPDGGAGQWTPIERFWTAFSGGKFEQSFEEPAVSGAGTIEFIFKFEAEGYRTFVTRVVNAEEETARFDIRMEPSAATKITVLLPNGKPAAHTQLAFATASEQITFGAGGFQPLGTVIYLTDADGQYSWQSDENVVEILAIHPQGFAHLIPAALQDKPTIELQGWGCVEGTIRKNGKAVTGRKLGLMHRRTNTEGPGVYWDGNAVTDASGQFRFAPAPPGDFSLVYHSPVPNQPGSFALLTLQDLVIRAGVTNSVDYDDDTIQVTARLIWPPDFRRDPKQQAMALIHSIVPPVPREFSGSPEGLARWRSQPEIAEILSKARSWMLYETAGNLWKNTSVPPGEYQISASVSVPGTNGTLGSVLLSGNAKISVERNSTEDTFNVGDLVLERVSLPGAATTP
jgi:hypothetical protein